MLHHRLKQGYQRFLNIFLHLRVAGFIAMGFGTIFLTFLTEDNALELVISGIASVFIGIGVNNYTVIEDRQKKNLFQTAILRRCLRNVQAGQEKTNWLLAHDLQQTDAPTLRRELEDLSLLLDNAADFCHFEIRHHTDV